MTNFLNLFANENEAIDQLCCAMMKLDCGDKNCDFATVTSDEWRTDEGCQCLLGERVSEYKFREALVELRRVSREIVKHVEQNKHSIPAT